MPNHLLKLIMRTAGNSDAVRIVELPTIHYKCKQTLPEHILQWPNNNPS